MGLHCSFDFPCQINGTGAGGEPKSELFNVYELFNIGKSTFITIDGLNLEQNGTYFVWVIGKKYCFLTIKKPQQKINFSALFKKSMFFFLNQNICLFETVLLSTKNTYFN